MLDLPIAIVPNAYLRQWQPPSGGLSKLWRYERRKNTSHHTDACVAPKRPMAISGNCSPRLHADHRIVLASDRRHVTGLLLQGLAVGAQSTTPAFAHCSFGEPSCTYLGPFPPVATLLLPSSLLFTHGHTTHHSSCQANCRPYLRRFEGSLHVRAMAGQQTLQVGVSRATRGLAS